MGIPCFFVYLHTFSIIWLICVVNAGKYIMDPMGVENVDSWIVEHGQLERL